MLKPLIIGLLCSLPAIAFAQIPKFSDYPAKVYNGPAAKLVLDSQDAKDFRTRLRDALKEKPNFAGEYVITMWGCGAGCRSYSIINKRTERLLKDGFGGEGGGDVTDAKANSRLIITEGPQYEGEYSDRKVGYNRDYYVLNGQKLQLIKRVPIKEPNEE